MELNGTLTGRRASQGRATTARRGRSVARGLSLPSPMTVTWLTVLVVLATVVALVPLAGPEPAGSVSGQGSIASGPGAYALDPALSGPAQFSLAASCEEGGRSPQGTATLVVPAADFAFETSSCDWVSLAGGAVKMAGSGTVNGAGDYGFMLTATDTSGGDGFRITVWDRATNTIVYDNQPAAAFGHVYPRAANLTGGSIGVRR